MDKIKSPSEHDEQVALVRALRNMGMFVYANGNGSKRDIITATRLKAEGILAGIPDLCIVRDHGKILFLEMKRREGGKLSPEQIKIHAELTKKGHDIIVGFGAKDAMEKIKEIMFDKT